MATKPATGNWGRKPTAGAKSKAMAINIHDIKTVKALADRLGAEKVRQLVSILV
jgi:hypothetical protein